MSARIPRVALAVGVALTLGGTTMVSLAAAPSAYSRPGAIERVSVSSSGAQSRSGLVGCSNPLAVAGMDISADGRYVVFSSNAVNLAPGAAGVQVGHPACNVFWRDRVLHTTKLVSVGVGGTPALGQSGAPSISADGRYVAFMSDATNVVPGDTNQAWDVFVRDMRSGLTTRVSAGLGGAQAGGPTKGNQGSMKPSISADGRYVAFSSDADNLVAGDTNGATDVFVHDRVTGRNVRASVASGGGQATGPGVFGSGNPSISGNGRFVTFSSTATNLAPPNVGAPAGITEVYRHDLKTKQTVLISIASNGARAAFAAFPTCTLGAKAPVDVPPTGVGSIDYLLVYGSVLNLCGSNVGSYGGHAISDDGRYVTFVSNATNLVPNDTNYTPPFGGHDIFVRDVLAGRTERVSVSSNGQQLSPEAETPNISGDGRTVVFAGMYDTSQSCDALPVSLPVDVLGCASSGRVVVAYDRIAGTFEILSKPTAAGQSKPGSCKGTTTPVVDPASTNSFPGAVSRDGRFVTFQSEDAGLVAGDSNNSCDYFVRDRGANLGAGSPLTATGAASAAGATTGARVVAARLVSRPTTQDLYLRWDVRRLAPVVNLPTSGLLYGMSFTAKGLHYQVRAERVPGPDFDTAGGASFALFREGAAGIWTHVAGLKGGYGTIGDSVVTAVPRSLLGSQAQLTDVTAYTALGSYLSGPTRVLDSLRLSR